MGYIMKHKILIKKNLDLFFYDLYTYGWYNTLNIMHL